MSQKIAVIMVSHKRVKDTIGGIESMIKVLVRKFHENEIPVSVVYRELFRVVGVLKYQNYYKGNYGTSESLENKAILVSELLFTLANMLFSIFAALQIIKLIKYYRRKGNLVIIHAMDTVYGGLSVFLASSLLRVPFVAHTHGVRAYFMHTTSKSSLVKTIDFLVETIVIKRCSMLISVNQQAADFWIMHGTPKDKIRVISVSIETKLFAPSNDTRVALRGKLGIDPNSTVFGYIGRLSPEKNLLLLIEAFYSANVDAKLMMVGDGPLMSMLKSYVQSKKIKDKVIFTGFRNDVHRIVNALDVLVLPSFIEGLPTVILEAFSNGKSVIASNIPAIREVVSHGKEGFLFNPLDVNQLKEDIVKLYQSSKLRAVFGQNAREKAKLYDAERFFGQILKVYEEIVRCKAK